MKGGMSRLEFDLLVEGSMECLRARGDTQCGGLDEWAGDGCREDFSANAVAFLSLVPTLPARLEEVGGREESVVSESCRYGGEVGLAVLGNELVNVGGEIRQDSMAVDGGAELVCCQQTGSAIGLDDWEVFKQLRQGCEWRRKVDLGGSERKEAGRCCDGEGVKGSWESGRVGEDVWKGSSDGIFVRDRMVFHHRRHGGRDTSTCWFGVVVFSSRMWGADTGLCWNG